MSSKLREWYEWLRLERILVQQHYLSSLDALTAIAGLFVENIDVTPGYTNAVLKREREYPTGLPTEPYGVAIPHADGRYVLKPGLGVATLKTPIVFQEMGNSTGSIPVRLIILIALPARQQGLQAEVLQGLLALIQKGEFLDGVTQCRSNNEIMEMFQRYK